MIKRIFHIPLLLLRHPFSGYYSLKHEKLGKPWHVFVNLFLFWASYSFMKQYSSILISDINERSINSLVDLTGICAVFLLWCIGNWSITSLVDGEGKFYEIAIASSYALVPMLFTFIPITILSRFLIQDETAFYFLILNVSIVWFAFLLFTATLTVHNFTVFKTILTIFLTFLSIFAIIFLLLLMFTLLQQLWVFISSVYTEIVYG